MHANEKKGQNSEAMLETNRSLILQILAKHDVCSRVQIAEETGLKQATITNLVNDLIGRGIVEEVGNMEGKKGRRRIGIALRAEHYKVIGIKVARGSYSVGLFDLKGNHLLTDPIQKIAVKDSHRMLEQVKRRIQELLDQYEDIYAIGIAVPGPYLRYEGRIMVMSEFPGWNDIHFIEEFDGKFGIPVYIEHDANAGALAEWRYGGHDLEQGVLVHFLASEGIGAGIVSNGVIFSGSHGIAGEVGHISINSEGKRCECGNRGCLETYCSSIAFEKHAREQLQNYPESVLYGKAEFGAQDIFAAARQGDAFCIEQVRRAGYYMGCGIANVVNIYDPDVVVISDIMSGGGGLLLEESKATVKDRILPGLYDRLKITFSTLPIDPILHGAAAIATDQLLKNTFLLNKSEPGKSYSPHRSSNGSSIISK